MNHANVSLASEVNRLSLGQPLAVRLTAEVVNDGSAPQDKLRAGNSDSKKLFALVTNILQFHENETLPEFYRLMATRGRTLDAARYFDGEYDEKLDEIEAKIAPTLWQTQGFGIAGITAARLNEDIFRVSFNLDPHSQRELDAILAPLDELPHSTPTESPVPDPAAAFVLDLPAFRIRSDVDRRERQNGRTRKEKLETDGSNRTIEPGTGLSVARGFAYHGRKNKLTT